MHKTREQTKEALEVRATHCLCKPLGKLLKVKLPVPISIQQLRKLPAALPFLRWVHWLATRIETAEHPRSKLAQLVTVELAVAIGIQLIKLLSCAPQRFLHSALLFIQPIIRKWRWTTLARLAAQGWDPFLIRIGRRVGEQRRCNLLFCGCGPASGCSR
jgi:hypothetical protein